MKANAFEIRTESQARDSFWSEAPRFLKWYYAPGQRQNQYPEDVRVAWCDWVDAAQKSGRMSAELAQDVTL